jgi:diketogulonate reductase-like aldo/keto reductase
MNRRKSIKSIISAGAVLSLGLTDIRNSERKIKKRIIPSTGQFLPIIGVGTWQTFDVGTSASVRQPLEQVLIELNKYGGSVIDSSPMYGESEGVVGDLSSKLKLTDSLFMATKVWTTGKQEGIKQMENSIKLLKKPKPDLMQVHNLVDWRTHLKTLYNWKEQGKIKYIGITHYHEGAYHEVERIMTTESLDFIQINYSINSRAAEERILPLAKDKGIAVLINRPYSGGALFSKVKDKQLPVWAKEIDCSSWGQFFLKYLISNDAVTCVIPGTSKPHHMIDNLQAGIGVLPSEAVRRKMINYIKA